MILLRNNYEMMLYVKESIMIAIHYSVLFAKVGFCFPDGGADI